MIKNVGTIDRIVRLLVVATIGVAYAQGALAGWLAAALGVVALVALLTSLFSTCPAYGIFGISTCKRG